MLRVYMRLLAPTTAMTMDEEAYRGFEQSLRGSNVEDQREFDSFLKDILIPHRDWLFVHEERLAMQSKWDAFFGNYDVLLCPVAPLPAIKHQNETAMADRRLIVAGEERPYLDHFGWMGPFGAMGLPASVAPAGRTPAGLPVGLQVVGPHLEDHTTIAFVTALAAEFGGFEPPPDYARPEGATRAKVR